MLAQIIPILTLLISGTYATNGVQDSKVCGIDNLVSLVEVAIQDSNCLEDIMGPQICVKTCEHFKMFGQYVLDEWDEEKEKYASCNRTGYTLLATITDTSNISQVFAEMLSYKTDCLASQDGKPIRACDGSFGTCQANCTQTYSISYPAINGGADCTHAAGDTKPCTGGQCVPVACDGSFGTCRSNCKQAYSITTPAANGGTACAHTDGDTQDCTVGQCEEWGKRRDKGAFCCESMIASCEACQAGLSVQQFCNITANKDVYGCCKVRNDCEKNCTTDMETCPDGTLLSRDEDCNFPSCPVKTCDGDCMTWFDGCNTCKCENGTKTMCTRKWCARYEQAKCMDEDEPEDKYNCNTREVWTAEKKKWCCTYKKLGCAPRIQCPRDCSSWYDGCNTCTCKDGFLGACTERFCFRKTDPKCLDDQCPRDCSSWYDGCNTCTCENGKITECTKHACLVKRPAKCLDKCVVVACPVGYEVVGADKEGCGGKCVHNCRTREEWTAEKKDWCCVHKQIGCKYNCKTKEVWSAEKRQWCCRNQRLGCCPVVRCASPKPGCTRTWVDDINDFGCALYPCGKDECPQETRSQKKPQISIKDSRGVDRLRVTAEEDNDDTKVTLQIMDTKGRPRVSLGAQKISMKETIDIVRRRNIVRAIVDAAEGSVMNVSEAGLSEEMVEHLKERKVTDVVFAKARAKSKTNPTDCSEADINLVRDGNNTMAFEIVLNKTGDQSFKCYNGKPLSLLTLKRKNEDTQNEYEAHCWSESAWKKKGTYKEKGQYNCSRLSKYTNFIATDLGAMTVSMAEEESALECESDSDCGSHSDEYCGYSCIDNKCAEWCESADPVSNCTNPKASNFNPYATTDDGSCYQDGWQCPFNLTDGHCLCPFPIDTELLDRCKQKCNAIEGCTGFYLYDKEYDYTELGDGVQSCKFWTKKCDGNIEGYLDYMVNTYVKVSGFERQRGYCIDGGGVPQNMINPDIDLIDELNGTATTTCSDCGGYVVPPHGSHGDFKCVDRHVTGCRGDWAFNYNPDATVHNGSECVHKIYGCMNKTACNFDETANTERPCKTIDALNVCGGHCISADGTECADVLGCMNVEACNFDSNAERDDGSCKTNDYDEDGICDDEDPCVDEKGKLVNCGPFTWGGVEYTESGNYTNGNCTKGLELEVIPIHSKINVCGQGNITWKDDVHEYDTNDPSTLFILGNDWVSGCENFLELIPDCSTPDPEVPAPSPDTPAPSPDTPAPSPDMPAPSPDTPDPEVPAPSPDTSDPEVPAPSPDTPSPDTPAPSPDTPAPSPDTPEPDPDVTFGPGVPKIEACSEDSVTVLWEGTHNLVETESAECDSNVTETWLTWDERETTGYKKTFHNLGGQYRGQTRYFQCSEHCGGKNARFEVHCPLIVDPDRPVTVNTSGSNLETPAMIVAVSVGALLAILLAFIMCPRPKKPANNQPAKSQYHALSQEDKEEQAELKPLKWIP